MLFIYCPCLAKNSHIVILYLLYGKILQLVTLSHLNKDLYLSSWWFFLTDLLQVMHHLELWLFILHLESEQLQLFISLHFSVLPNCFHVVEKLTNILKSTLWNCKNLPLVLLFHLTKLVNLFELLEITLAL